MAFQLASAFVRIATKGLNALSFAFGKVRGLLSGLLGFMDSAIGRAGGLLGALSVGAAVKLAGDAEEIQQKFDVVFGGVRQSADKWANDFARTIGRSVNTTKEQMAAIQGNLLSLQFGTEEAAEMTKQLHQAAIDLASFSNKSDARAINAVVGAIQNEREAMKSLDIVITEAAVKAEVARQGNANLTGALMEQARARATLTIIQRKGTAAMGDAERTAGSFVNRMKGLVGTIKDVAADIGRAFLPALAALAKKVTDFLRSIQPRIREVAQSIGVWGKVMIENWDLTWNIMKQSVRVAVNFIGDMFAAIPHFWSFHLGRMLHIATKAGPAIAMTLWESIKKTLSRGVFTTEDVTAIMKQFGLRSMAAFQAGFEGKGLGGFVTSQISGATKKSMAELEKMIKELERLKKDAEAKAKTIADKNQEPFRSRVGVELKMPTGFIDIVQANKKVQESLLGKDDKQQAILNAAQMGNRIQDRVAKGVDRLVALQQRPNPANTVRVATP